MLFYENPNGKLYHGDCLEIMKDIPDGSVDMVLCDLPYGMTKCDWDVVIPFEPLWEQYNRICKTNAPILLFAALLFAADVTISNRKYFRYKIIWVKSQKMGFLDAKRKPLKQHEEILVFYKKSPTYNPQMSKSFNDRDKFPRKKKIKKCSIYNVDTGLTEGPRDGTRYPTDVINFSNWNGVIFGNKNTKENKINGGKLHPTQKPVPLLEYLIRTYSNEGETILDNCIGSGSTAVAAENTGRRWIGIEKEERFCEVAKKRIAEAAAQGRLLLLQG